MRRAQAVLERNRRGAYTCPSVKLYPHQWLWDSCFTAIGIARYDPPRAAGELRSLFRGQWANGMLPHMLFAEGAHDVGSSRVWQSRRHPDAPRDVATSCITQPPLAAIAVERVAHALPADDRRAFLDEMVPKLVAYHRWLFRERTLDDSALDHADPPVGVRPRLDPAVDARAARVADAVVAAGRGAAAPGAHPPLVALRHALPPGHRTGVGRRRPAHARARGAPQAATTSRCTRCRATARCSSRTSASTRCSRRPTRRSPDSATPRSTDDIARARAPRSTTLWHAPTQQYCSRDAVTHAPLPQPTVAGVPPAVRRRRPRPSSCSSCDTDANWPAYPVPSVPGRHRPTSSESRYWKGPTWVNTNWMIIQGLEQLGEHRARRRPPPAHARAGRRARLRRVLLAAHRRGLRRRRVLVDRRAHRRPRRRRRRLDRVDLLQHRPHQFLVAQGPPPLDRVGERGAVESSRAGARPRARTRRRSTGSTGSACITPAASSAPKSIAAASSRPSDSRMANT